MDLHSFEMGFLAISQNLANLLNSLPGWLFYHISPIILVLSLPSQGPCLCLEQVSFSLYLVFLWGLIFKILKWEINLRNFLSFPPFYLHIKISIILKCFVCSERQNQTPSWCNLLKCQVLLGKPSFLYNLIQITTLILNGFLWNYHVEPKLVQLN